MGLNLISCIIGWTVRMRRYRQANIRYLVNLSTQYLCTALLQIARLMCQNYFVFFSKDVVYITIDCVLNPQQRLQLLVQAGSSGKQRSSTDEDSSSARVRDTPSPPTIMQSDSAGTLRVPLSVPIVEYGTNRLKIAPYDISCLTAILECESCKMYIDIMSSRRPFDTFKILFNHGISTLGHDFVRF